MSQCRLEQHRDRLRLVVQEELQLAHTLRNFIGWRRNESRVVRTGSPDPVLAAPELPRRLVPATTFAQQHAMDLYRPEAVLLQLDDGNTVAVLCYTLEMEELGLGVCRSLQAARRCCMRIVAAS